MNVEKIFKESFSFCKTNATFFWKYTLLNLFLVAFSKFALGGVSNALFLVWLVIYYVFWSIFFRDIFNQTPCYKRDCIFNSFVPSTRVFLITFSVMFLLAFLPMLPMLLAFIPNLPVDVTNFIDRYSLFLKEYMEDSDVMDLFLSFVFIFVAPLVFYRPFFAWISSVLGRSGLIVVAYKKTENNYWQFFIAGLIMNLSYVILKNLAEYVGSFSADADVSKAISSLVLVIISSPFIVYFNVFIAKAYEFFFVEK